MRMKAKRAKAAARKLPEYEPPKFADLPRPRTVEWVATDERRESWRPPLFRPVGQLERRAARPEPKAAPKRTQLPRFRKGQRPSQAPQPAATEPPAAPWQRTTAPRAAAPGALHGGTAVPKVNIYQLRPAELELFVTQELGLPPPRVEHVRHCIYKRGAANFSEMKLAQSEQAALAAAASVGAEDWAVLAEQRSNDGTVKRAYAVPGGHAIEAVLMPYEDGRNTACISTQVGCAQGCVFCATGQMGFKRHLTDAEIFEQAARFSGSLRRQGKRLSGVVLLGMGEPLANYGNMLSAVHRIHDELEIGWRHITVSTVGLVPEIKRLAEERLPITLAISLHAATDAERTALLPVNRRFPITQVMDAARQYHDVAGRRVSFEWTLIKGQNDDEVNAERLGRLIAAGAPGSHVNLIPLNPTKGYQGGPTQRKAAERFVQILAQFGVEATVRVRRGIDIDAGCGQLAERASAEYKLAR